MSAICVQGRQLSEADLEFIRGLRAEHPDWSRQRLSEHLAQTWQWRNQAGRLKDMAVRTLLLKLQARGLIELPPPLTRNGNRRSSVPPSVLWQQPDLLHSSPPDLIVDPLAALQPVHLERIQTPPQRRRVTDLLQQHHYRGYRGAVGQNIQYLARDCLSRELAVLVFGAAAWKVASRDSFIGWSILERQARLPWVVNQQRFLILPWVRVPHLASHLLALALRQLSADWQERYGHPVWLVETFVEDQRFHAVSYQAAGWICVGQTTGRTRQDRQHTLKTPIKSVWLKPLHPRFRSHLCLV